MRRREGFDKLEQEIVKEKAAALGRTGERLEAALADAEALRLALDGESDPGRRTALMRDYEGARQRALLARTMLLIQREAIGLRHHRDVDQQFPEPPRRS